jgi:hypothetical protein
VEVNHEGEGASTSGALEDLGRGRTRRLVHSTAMRRLQRRGMYDREISFYSLIGSARGFGGGGEPQGREQT